MDDKDNGTPGKAAEDKSFLALLPDMMARAMKEVLVQRTPEQQQAHDRHIDANPDLYGATSRLLGNVGGLPHLGFLGQLAGQLNQARSVVESVQHFAKTLEAWQDKQLPWAELVPTPPPLPWETGNVDAAGKRMLNPDHAPEPRVLEKDEWKGAPQLPPPLDPSGPETLLPLHPPTTPEEKKLQAWEDADDSPPPPVKHWQAIDPDSPLPNPEKLHASAKDEPPAAHAFMIPPGEDLKDFLPAPPSPPPLAETPEAAIPRPPDDESLPALLPAPPSPLSPVETPGPTIPPVGTAPLELHGPPAPSRREFPESALDLEPLEKLPKKGIPYPDVEPFFKQLPAAAETSSAKDGADQTKEQLWEDLLAAVEELTAAFKKGHAGAGETASPAGAGNAAAQKTGGGASGKFPTNTPGVSDGGKWLKECSEISRLAVELAPLVA